MVHTPVGGIPAIVGNLIGTNAPITTVMYMIITATIDQVIAFDVRTVAIDLDFILGGVGHPFDAN